MLTPEKILSNWKAGAAPTTKTLLAFARAIAAEQREIDAKVCDMIADDGEGANFCAEAIRNQGEKK